MQQDVKVFRIAVIPAFLFIAGLGLSLYFCVMPMMFGVPDVTIMLIGAAGGALAGFLYAWIISVCFTVKFGSNGVYGHSFWGVRRFIAWQEIAEIRPFRLLNLRFLRLYRSDRTGPTWIPLFLASRSEWVEEVRRLAPSENPILEHLPYT